ncbi:hypothetical protein HDF15_005070, partial [Granulicella mallensis]|nr:hypothetical protein [Granulicella mallensis]
SSGWIICASSTYQEGTPLFIPSERYAKDPRILATTDARPYQQRAGTIS